MINDFHRSIDRQKIDIYVLYYYECFFIKKSFYVMINCIKINITLYCLNLFSYK